SACPPVPGPRRVRGRSYGFFSIEYSIPRDFSIGDRRKSYRFPFWDIFPAMEAARPWGRADQSLYSDMEAIALATSASQARMARIVRSIRVSRSQPRRSAPWRITSRLQPAANFLSLNFFFRLLTSMSETLPLGRILAAAQ